MRINKFTPIAASVALSLGLTGCNWFDDDNKKETVKPVQTFEGSASASFGTEVTGRAVKGSLSNAAVVVKTMNDAGEMISIIAIQISDKAINKIMPRKPTTANDLRTESFFCWRLLI